MDRTRTLLSRLIPAILSTIDVANDRPGRAAHAFLAALAMGDGATGVSDTGDIPSDWIALFGQFLEHIPGELAYLAQTARPEAYATLDQALAQETAHGALLGEQPERLWDLFFPEAVFLSEDPEEQITLLRDRRRVRVTAPPRHPITDPARELLFTSNALLTLPFSDESPEFSDPELRRRVENVQSEPQKFWYDHPIPLGVSAEANEVLYGLKGLAAALAVERQRGTAAAGQPVRVALSISVTHEGLRSPAGEWLRSVFAHEARESLEGLEVYGFTEDDTLAMVDLLTPFLNDPAERELLQEVFGVDGEYGRHYSFLKALPALWSVLAAPEIRGTFKLDLDQVFSQEKLLEDTGATAFELFAAPLWGAQAIDAEGNPIELGMIAGALVNEADIGKGLFTPDIPWPESIPTGEDLLFYKQRPMAVSTRAEMMTRYSGQREGTGTSKGTPVDASAGMPDGKTEALHRIHVTGGTNGIRIDSLRRHRPFTPTFVGRAEDQAYILSVLGSGGETATAPPEMRRLAYLHQPGLIMRHDKAAFAGQAVAAGKAGSYVGDLVRTLVFSDYASFLSGTPAESATIKTQLDPFTGCFITPTPLTSIALRLALHTVDTDRGSTEAREAILNLAAQRLPSEIDRPRGPDGELARQWHRERRGWDVFYNALDRIEALQRYTAAPTGAPTGVVTDARRTFRAILQRCRLA